MNHKVVLIAGTNNVQSVQNPLPARDVLGPASLPGRALAPSHVLRCLLSEHIDECWSITEGRNARYVSTHSYNECSIELLLMRGVL